jgi:protease-4
MNITTVKNKVARVTIDSMITDSEPYAEQLKTFFEDTNIKAIVVKIESPGGIPGSCQALFTEIQELKKQHPKPIIALVENMCASGGYYVACSTDHIIAAKSSLIGSIGAVFQTFFTVKDLAAQWHIQTYTVSAGKYKNAMNHFEAPTPEQLAMLQQVADSVYLQFATDVAKTRKLSLNDKDVWAEGKIFTGQQALDLHLIDETGSYFQVIEYIKKTALIEGPLEWVDPTETVSLLERLMGSSGRVPFVATLVQNCATQIKKELQSGPYL